MNKKELLILSIIIFLSIVMWLVADIYHTMSIEKINRSELPPLIVNYKIDKNILNLLEKKQP